MAFHIVPEVIQSVEHIKNVMLRLHYLGQPSFEVKKIFSTLYQISYAHAGIQFGEVDHASARFYAMEFIFIANVLMFIFCINIWDVLVDYMWVQENKLLRFVMRAYKIKGFSWLASQNAHKVRQFCAC